MKQEPVVQFRPAEVSAQPLLDKFGEHAFAKLWPHFKLANRRHGRDNSRRAGEISFLDMAGAPVDDDGLPDCVEDVVMTGPSNEDDDDNGDPQWMKDLVVMGDVVELVRGLRSARRQSGDGEASRHWQ